MSNDLIPWEERLKAEAKEVAANFKPSVGRIGLKSGVMTYEGQPVPNNMIDVVVLASAFENSYYTSAYDPNNLANPDCFALSLTGENMVPDPMVSSPPSTACESCPNLQWGSDPKPNSRGKACKEVVRLALLPTGNAKDPEAIAKSEVAVMKVSVTNVKRWGNYVQKLATTLGRPPWAVITEIKVVPDMKNQFRIEFTEKAVVANDLLDALSRRVEFGKSVVMTGYDSLGAQEREEEPAPTKKKKF